MQKRFLSVAASAVLLGAAGVAPAAAQAERPGGHPAGTHAGHSDHRTDHGGHAAGHALPQDPGPVGPLDHHAADAPHPAPLTAAASGPTAVYTARLLGANEVPVPGGPAVDDPDGRATALITVRGDRITFTLRWKGLVPSLGHIHQGAAGQNGPLKVSLFGSAMPDSVDAAAGRVAVTDAALAERIRTDPAGYYVNLHSAEFPGGAVRGQLRPLKGDSEDANPLDVIRGGKLRAFSDGAQEVPKDDASKVGDPDGHAVTFLNPKGTTVGYSMAWLNIQSPSLGHIHQGAYGKNGAVVLNLFNRPVPDGVFAVSGALTGQPRDAVKRVRTEPEDHYSNIHTPEFPDGAVRGQLFD
ncbi:CHRD domain-containing protein [Streptomyces sp. NPDC014894]|uniref:CHRD domain-containing protein n=1 Tax=Streptomyces sp. NPDC014894 TaxID=3364931 RepID=UPI0036F7083B